LIPYRSAQWPQQRTDKTRAVLTGKKVEQLAEKP
jgi:hypothetical protein